MNLAPTEPIEGDEKQTYTFYFDETLKDDKIKIDENGILNYDRPNLSDSFITVFSGIENSEIERADNIFLEFENKQRIRFPDLVGKEIKSTVIKKTRFRNGIASFDEKTFGFYSDLFDAIEQIKPILHISHTSKLEEFVKYSMFNTYFPSNVSYECMMYTLIKFLHMHGEADLFLSLRNIKSQREMDIFKNKIIKRMKLVEENSHGIERFGSKISGLNDFCIQFRKTKVDMKTTLCHPLNYNYIFIGLRRLLDSLKIDEENTSIIIDGIDNSYPEVKDYFTNSKHSDSINEPMLRLSDQIAGFIGRMIVSIENDKTMKEPDAPYQMGASKEELAYKRIINERWFEMDFKHFELYKQFARILKINNGYWNTLSGIYFDGFVSFIGLVNYINSFETYEKFTHTSLSEHREGYSNLCIDLMNLRFEDFMLNRNPSISIEESSGMYR